MGEMVALLVRMAHPAKMALMEHPDQLAQLDLHPPEHLVMMDNLELLELPEHPEKMVSTVPLAQLELEELLELQEHPERMDLTEPLAQEDSPDQLELLEHLELLEPLDLLELQAEL